MNLLPVIIGLITTTFSMLYFYSRVSTLKTYTKTKAKVLGFKDEKGTNSGSCLAVEIIDKDDIRHQIVGTQTIDDGGNITRLKEGNDIEIYLPKDKSNYQLFIIKDISFWLMPAAFLFLGLLFLSFGILKR